MPITPQFYDTASLIGVMQEQEPVEFYWAGMFTNQVNSDSEFIDFEKIPHAGRKLAPFVTPLSQGKPIYSRKAVLSRVKPAYIKPKDAVSPDRVMKRKPGELLAPTPMSPEQRRQAIIADILVQHSEAIDRTFEWLAARAVIDGKVVIGDDLMPEREVDFNRAPSNTIVLGSGARWNDPGVSIIENIESWRTICRRAEFGGRTNRLTVGPDAWDVMRKSDEIKRLLDLNTRGTDATVRIGLAADSEIEFVGNLGPDLAVYVYSDYYEVDGVVTPFLNPKDVVLTGPGMMGYRCFGAIQDPYAQYQSFEKFPRHFLQDDPAGEFVMTQSAPLMVPVNPNVTLKATVLA